MVPVGVCSFKASVDLLEDSFDLGFRCCCYMLSDCALPSLPSYLFADISLHRRRDSPEGRKICNSDLVNYLMTRVGPSEAIWQGRTTD